MVSVFLELLNSIFRKCYAHEALDSQAFLAHISVCAYCKSHSSGSHDSYIDPAEILTKTIKDPTCLPFIKFQMKAI